MYHRLKGSLVKIIHNDGSRIIVTIGRVIDYDEDIKTISIKTLEGVELYINALKIDKLQVLDEVQDD